MLSAEADLHNYSDNAKAEFNNCFIVHSKLFLNFKTCFSRSIQSSRLRALLWSIANSAFKRVFSKNRYPSSSGCHLSSLSLFLLFLFLLVSFYTTKRERSLINRTSRLPCHFQPLPYTIDVNLSDIRICSTLAGYVEQSRRILGQSERRNILNAYNRFYNRPLPLKLCCQKKAMN